MAKIKIKPMHKNIALGAGVLVIAAILLIPGMIATIGALITGQQNNCNDAPFDPNCFCDEGYNKQPTSTPFKVYCESDNLMFNPQDPNFETSSLAYAKAYLYENFPECDSIECPTPATLLFDGTVALTPEHRSVYFECRSTFGTDYWEFQAKIEDGTVEKAVCRNIYIPDEPEETKREEFKRICDESINNLRCNKIFSSTTSNCSTHEIYPAYDCAEGRECTKGVSYSFESWDQGYLPGWTGCGYIAQKSWDNPP